MGNNRNHDTVSSFRPNTFHPTKWKEGWKDVYHNGKYRRVIFWKNLNMAHLNQEMHMVENVSVIIRNHNGYIGFAIQSVLDKT